MKYLRKTFFVLFVILFCTQLLWAQTQNVIVYYNPENFCGWPANEGIWSWSNEIVVGFNLGAYLYNPDGHSHDPSVPLQTIQARSTDGGETWTVEYPEAFANDKPYESAHGRINFTHPDFAMKLRYRRLCYSYNRGQSWFGPFELPKMDQVGIRSRTDYMVNSQCEALFFVPVDKPDGKPDRCMAFKTSNGGGTFEFLSYMSPCPPLEVGDGDYATMPATVKVAEGTYISALRQRRASQNNVKWMDIYRSEDNCQTWRFLSNPVKGQWNPASLIKLADGRICLTYGWRSVPQGIRAKLSSDNGETWSDEIILRDDGKSWDLGYPRSVQRPDGKIVTIYYFTTDEKPEQHIAATIWQP